MSILLFVAGIALLIVGAELLVRGASQLAAAIGISPLVVGMTVVAFGTSAPELVVSMKAAVSGQASIAVGNVVGSNIFNVLFILGLSALIAPLVVSQQLIRVDVPLMIAASAVALILGLDASFGRLDGVLLFTGLLVYTAMLVYYGRKSRATQKEHRIDQRPDAGVTIWLKNTGFVIGGLALLVFGSRWLVTSGVSIAKSLGVSELIIGLTIIAAGTSLPEVVTSIVAGIRGERDIAVGNVVGSNLFNIMGVLGLTAIVAPTGIAVSPSVISFDMPIMIATAFACLPIFFTDGSISRWEGALLLAYYIAYTTYLILAASHHDALPFFGATMLYFAIPLTTITLFVVTLNAIRRNRKRLDTPNAA